MEDPSRLGRDAGDIGREIVANILPRPDVSVKVTIEIEGDDPNGFDEAAVRAISENARELGFRPQLAVEDAFKETATAVAAGVFRDPKWRGHSAIPLNGKID